MKCPTCKDVDLLMTDRQGIEIDYCPNCRGVWLDRGELDRIIDRSLSATPAPVGQPVARQPQPVMTGHPPQYRDDDYRHRRRKSFLGELFDFD